MPLTHSQNHRDTHGAAKPGLKGICLVQVPEAAQWAEGWESARLRAEISLRIPHSILTGCDRAAAGKAHPTSCQTSSQNAGKLSPDTSHSHCGKGLSPKPVPRGFTRLQFLQEFQSSLTLSRMLMSEPLASSSFTSSMCLYSVAQIIGVQPPSSWGTAGVTQGTDTASSPALPLCLSLLVPLCVCCRSLRAQQEWEQHT